MKSRSVLIVDDNENVRSALRRFIENGRSELHVVGEAANGVEAIHEAKSLKPDIIFMDLFMPELNGADASFAIRQELPDTRIIAFTMGAELLGERLAKSLGVDVVISKSGGATALIEALQDILSRNPS